jgi:hypothetical protein
LQEQAQSNELVIATTEAAQEYSNALVKFTERKFVPFVKEVQNVRPASHCRKDFAVSFFAQQLSNSWIIIGTTLAIELLFILSVTVPYTRKVRLGLCCPEDFLDSTLAQVHVAPWKWATFQLTPDHPWSVTLPDLAVVAQLSFARVFLV